MVWVRVANRPVFLKPGDKIVTDIDGLGQIENLAV